MPGGENVGVTRRTEVVELDPEHPDPEVLEHAGSVLRSGGLVAFPTETVYGLGADAGSAEAVRSIFAAKGRPSTDPLIVHVDAADSPLLVDVVAEWPDRAAALARRFWPGPLTLVVTGSPGIPAEVGAGTGTIAVRVPAHAVARGLIAAAGRPVAAPSANRFGRVSPTTAAHVLDELDGRIDLVLDAGPTTMGVESSVLDLTVTPVALLRPGGITLEQLEDALGEVHHVPRRVLADGTASSAPGQLLRHYSPRTPVVMVDASGGVSGELMQQLLDALCSAGVVAAPVDLPGLPDQAARQLYAALRDADELGVVLLLAPIAADEGIGRAVNDRLFRAAHGRVVSDAEASTVARLLSLVD